MRVMNILLPHQKEAIIRQPGNQHVNSIILNLNFLLFELPLISLHFVHRPHLLIFLYLTSQGKEEGIALACR